MFGRAEARPLRTVPTLYCAVMRHVSAAALALVLSLPAASAAQDHSGHAPAVAGRIPAEILVRPVPLRDGIGRVSHPTSTMSKEAQAFYEQGLAYLHSTCGSRPRARSTRRSGSTMASRSRGTA